MTCRRFGRIWPPISCRHWYAICRAAPVSVCGRSGGGGDRRGLVLEADGDLFVGPDNGLLSRVARRARRARVWRIDWRPDGVSASFHGRDWFAPVAAALCRGDAVALGAVAIDGLIGAHWPDDLPAVVYVDGYGNLMCGLRAAAFAPAVQLVAAGRTLDPRPHLLRGARWRGLLVRERLRVGGDRGQPGAGGSGPGARAGRSGRGGGGRRLTQFPVVIALEILLEGRHLVGRT